MAVKKDQFPVYLFHQGTNYCAQELLGAHLIRRGRGFSTVFRVWAPNAEAVCAVGTFNDWNPESHPLQKLNEQGLWEGYAPRLALGSLYKFWIKTTDGRALFKADPYARYCELPPGTASRFYPATSYPWQDVDWMTERSKQNVKNQPINIYEVHLGSWRLKEDGSPYSYLELAPLLADYALEMGYTHLELLPIAEYPFGGSWGYQTTGYFAPTSRYGEPDDLRFFIDHCHQKGIGVILDWVGSHFPKDAHGLYEFDGQPLYEYQGNCKNEQTQWGTEMFDYGRNEVQSFLVSSALFWVESFHLDGIRVDAVAAMLYLDYGREDEQSARNESGGRENKEAIAFLKKLNSEILTRNPGVMMIAEEATSWPLVTRPPYVGGLGFTFKWNVGWANDSLSYLELDPIYRSYNHDKLTFGMFYAFTEHFILPISHHAVVHGKCSLLDKTPGDYWRKFAGTRAFLGFMMAHPGKKLSFMGNELGQFVEWNYQRELDWMLLDYQAHQQFKDYVRQLNHLYQEIPALYEIDDSWDGFKWIIPDDSSQNILVFCRKDSDERSVVVVVNFSPEVRHNYCFGVPCAGTYRELINSDHPDFGGSGVLNTTLDTQPVPMHSYAQSVEITVPPLAAVYLVCEGEKNTQQ